MDQTTIWGIVHNAVLLIIMVVFYGAIGLSLHDNRISLRHIAVGVSIGLICVTAVVTPMQFIRGSEFTIQSIVLSLSGLFFGATPTLIAVGMAILYSVGTESSGLFTGIHLILTPAVIGFGWRKYRKCEATRIPFHELLIFGLIVHAAIVFIRLALPGSDSRQSILPANLVLLSAYPILTALIGRLFQSCQNRHMAELALIDSGNRYRQLFEAESDAMNFIHTLLEVSPDGIVAYKATGQAVSANPKAAEIIGVSQETLLKENFREIPFWKSNGLLDLALKALETGQEQENEITGSTSADKMIWLFCRISPFWHNNEQHILCMFTDISARKQTEEVLEKRIIALTHPIENQSIPFEDLFNLEDIQSIQDSFSEISGVAAVIIRPDSGAPITKQSHYCRLCKDILRKSEKARMDCLKTESAILHGSTTGPNIQSCLCGGMWSASTNITAGGQNIANWVIGQVRNPEKTNEDMRQYAHSIQIDEDEFINALHELPVMNRKQFENTASAMSVFARQLSALAYQNVQQARFIAERDRAVNQIRQMNQELEQRVRERTAALENANKELEAFAHSIAHDLRTPLRSILSFSQILQQDYSEKLDDEGRHYLDRISVAVPFMAQLIDDLLRLSEVTRRNLTPQKINLSSLAEEILEAFTFNEPDRIVTWDIQPDLIVSADASLIAIAIENLLSNAWKFTSLRPSARIEIGAQTFESETVYYVRDNGVGFDSVYADKLFIPFQRLHTKDIYEGNGIGLAIVQSIIQKHGGRIWAKGAVDQGATFWFTLPA